MITCPSCNHQNPEGSLQCENCYTPLPASTSCPNCGASVQTDATFCGQCGFNLQAENSPVEPVAPVEAVAPSLDATAVGLSPNIDLEEIPLPDEIPISASIPNDEPNIIPETDVSLSPWDVPEEEETNTTAQVEELPSGFPEVELTESGSYAPEIPEIPEVPETDFVEVTSGISSEVEAPFPAQSLDLDPPHEPEAFTPPETTPEPEIKEVDLNQNLAVPAVSMAGATQLQIQTASLLHLQTNTSIEIPSHLDIVHFGKPNGQIPPDIDVSGFPDSEVVSRVHADIRIEGDHYFIEDTGSSNGTYINHAPLQKGNRHRLRTGDRIALGKGDLVTFIFQID